MNEILMEYFLVNTKMDLDMVLAFLNGTMERYLKVIGKMEWSVDMEYGNRPKEITMKVNGFIIDNMDKVYLSTELALTKDSSKIFWKMGKVLKDLLMVIFIKDNTKRENQMAKGVINGAMVGITKVSSRKEWDKVKGI